MPLPRRSFLQKSAFAVASLATLRHSLDAAEQAVAATGKIHHSACKWCYPKVSLDDLCAAGKEMGLTAIDLLQPKEFATIQKYGLICAMTSSPTIKTPEGKALGGITAAFNRKEHHDLLIQAYEPHIAAVSEAGYTNLICFSGNREGLDDATGLKNCAEGLKKLMPLCEQKKVVLCMELLNSRVNHPDYMCDKSAWGIELCQQVGSPNFRLLYDIYHMQIMEGDVIATIQRSHEYFAHYHTGGVPGRHEIDETQELYYPAIMRAIAATGHTGHVAQEFVPARPDVLASLRQAVGICEVKA